MNANAKRAVAAAARLSAVARVVYQQFRRWSEAGCFEALVSDMRSIIRVAQGRAGQPSAVILDGRTLQSSCESGPRAGYDGYKRRKGSKVHMAVDTLGHLIDLAVTPPESRSARKSRHCARRCKTRQATRCESHGPIKTTRAKTQRPTLRPPASSCGWSSCPRRRKASCCCPGAGWWSAASARLPDSGAWRVTCEAPAARPGGAAFPGLRHPHAAQGCDALGGEGKCITRSNPSTVISAAHTPESIKQQPLGRCRQL